MSGSPLVRWAAGGEAQVLAFENERAELRSTVPFAAGSRPTGSLLTAPEQPIWIKVHRSRRDEDGRYHVWCRVLNVTRDLRDQLEKALAAASASPPASSSPSGSNASDLTSSPDLSAPSQKEFRP